MLMNARRARECSDKVASEASINQIDEAIMNACTKGKYTVTVKWDINLTEELKEKIVNEVYNKGYDALVFPDTITIYW